MNVMCSLKSISLTTSVESNNMYLLPFFLCALGELLTAAQWIRLFVEAHPDYKKDSVVGETICFDLLNTFDRIGRGEIGAPKLFGKPHRK